MRPETLITPGNLRAAEARRVPFPHMGPHDTRVWNAALRLGLVKFDRLEYDVRLGGKGADLVDKEHIHRAMWDTLLRKRVDVIGWQGKQVWVVEVKPVASFAALGQCIGYRDLWKRERPGVCEPRAMCVCAIADPDLLKTFERAAVRVVSLPPDVVDDVLGHAPDGH